MDLHRRKLYMDRLVWGFVLVAAIVIAGQYIARPDGFELYLLIGWGSFVLWLLLFSEMKLGKKISLGNETIWAGWAAYAGRQDIAPSGVRSNAKSETIVGKVSLGSAGVVFEPKKGGEPIRIPWLRLWGWRLNSVLPFLPRASAYLSVTDSEGVEYVLHVHGAHNWRKALREASIVQAAKVRRQDPTTKVTESDERDVFGPEDEPEVQPELLLEAEPEIVLEPPVEKPESIDTPEPVETPELETPELVVEEPSNLESVIGLECHVELSTASKVFCGCPVNFGAQPNTQICEVCTGQPGTLPVINAKALEYAIKIALALNCSIAPSSMFHRKNYFYPDMPKNYQISQYDVPLGSNGYIDLQVDGKPHRVRVHRVHLEEDTGKITHGGGSGRIGDSTHALIDYNRAGVPLVEIVSEPEITSSEEAKAFLVELRALLESLDVSDVRMDQGSFRCDANVSMKPIGQAELGTKTEVKNMNSVRSVGRALEHEIKRQTKILNSGEEVVQETRHFDENAGITLDGRKKEGSDDYRYFPEPDLVAFEATHDYVEGIRSSIGEQPSQRRARLAIDLGEVDARSICSSKALADAFEQAARVYTGPSKSIARWYLAELAAIANDKDIEPHEVVGPSVVVELQKLVDNNVVSISQAKGKLLARVVETGRPPSEIVAEENMAQMDSSDELTAIVDAVIANNQDAVAQVKSGKQGAINALVGSVMKETKGRANPATARELLLQRLAP